MAYAWDGLARRPARTATTALGIGLATALVVLLLALSAGITSSATALAQSSGVDLMATSANTTLRSSTFPPVAGAHGFGPKMTAVDPNVATASPWLIADLVFANSSLEAAAARAPGGAAVPAGWSPTGSGMVGWIPGANAGIETPTISAGPGWPGPGDPHWANGTYSGPSTHAIVLDQALAGVLGVGVGATVWVGATSPPGPSALAAWFANATAFHVVGISGPFWLIPSALLAFGYLSELQGLLGGVATRSDTASLVLVHLHDPSQEAADRSRLASAFPGLTIFSVGDILGAVQSVIDLYRTFGTLVGAVGVAVALLFTTTVLLMSVDDRSRELAVLRAIGFGPGWIVRQVVAEGVLLGAFGLAVGIPLGYAGALGVSQLLVRFVPGLPAGFSFVRFDASVALGALAVVLAVGLLAAIAPALRALTLPVAQELRAP